MIGREVLMIRLLSVMSVYFMLVLTPSFAKASDVIAKVGRAKITNEALQKRIAQFPAQSQEYVSKKENKEKILDQIIDEEVLYQKARKLRLHRDPEYKAQIENAQRQLLIASLIREQVDKKVDVSETDLRAYYDSNKDQFASFKQRKLSHILLKTEKDAKKVRQLLRKGRSFKRLAKKYSVDSSKDSGGDLGWVSKNQVVPEFGNAAFSLKREGSISGVVKSQFGYHIIKFHKVRVQPQQKYEDAKAQIQQALIGSKKRKLFDDLVASAKEKIKIKKNVEKID